MGGAWVTVLFRAHVCCALRPILELLLSVPSETVLCPLLLGLPLSSCGSSGHLVAGLWWQHSDSASCSGILQNEDDTPSHKSHGGKGTDARLAQDQFGLGYCSAEGRPLWGASWTLNGKPCHLTWYLHRKGQERCKRSPHGTTWKGHRGPAPSIWLSRHEKKSQQCCTIF